MQALHRVTLPVIVATGLSVAAAVLPAHAEQSYPSKPIRLVVPFTAGGGTDIVARMLGMKMGDHWGQAVVIENRTGAGGTIGANIVAKATPDGHTLLVSSAAFAISAALKTDLPYDPIKDFAGVSRIGYATGALIVPPTLGVKTVTELIELAKAKPGEVIFAHAGIGSSTHMNGERFRLAAGIKVKHVGFKGGFDAGVEVIAGRVQYAIIGLTSTLPFIRDKRLIALAVNTPQRSPLLPDVPTIAETLPSFSRDGASVMLAPAGTPLAVRIKISNEVKRIFELPEVKEKLQSLDYFAAPTSPEEHERVLRADIETFAGVVRLAGLRPK
jgi:tripartite-type tricarboxylate transporter receptor subunit TctC